MISSSYFALAKLDKSMEDFELYSINFPYFSIEIKLQKNPYIGSKKIL